MSDKLTYADMSDYHMKRENMASKEGAILNRIEYIIKTLLGIQNKHLLYWYFDGADEGQVGPLPDLNYDTIDNIIMSPSLRFNIVLNDGELFRSIEEGIPTRWLYEDFEEEIKSGIEKYAQQQKEKVAAKIKNAAKKRANMKKLEAIKAKLTPEEWKLLRAAAHYGKLK